MSRRRAGAALALAVLALLPGRRLAAQAEGALGGVVRDAATRNPVPDVLVTVEEGRRGAVTDSAGSYRIRQLRAGTYTVTLRRIGYRPRALTGVVVRAAATTPLDVTLDPSPLQLEELAVEAVSDPLLDPLQTQSEQRITAEDLRRLPVASLADAVALTAGTVGESFRGGRPGQQSFILDGLGVKNQLDASTSGGGVLRIPPDILTEASVITNGFSARYGQALSGLINVVTRDGGERWSGRAAYETDRPMAGSADRGLDRMVFSADGPVVGGVRALVGVDLSARQDFDAVNAPAPIPAADPRSTTPYPLPHNSGEQYTGTAKLTIPIGQRQTVRLFGLMSSEQRLLYDQSYKYDTDFAPGLRVAGTLATGQWQYASAPTARRPFVLDVRAGWFDREFMRGTLAEPLEQRFGAFTFDRMHFVGEEIASAQDTAAASAPVPGFTPPAYSSNTPWGVPAFFLGGGSRGEIAWNRYQELRTQVDGTLGLGRGDLYFGGEYLSQDVKTFQRALAALPVGNGDSVPPAAASAFKPQAFALYTELNQRLDELGIVLGLRYDQFDSRQDLPGEEGGPKRQLNPRIAVSTVLKGATVVASIGSFSQPPDYQYLVDAAFDDTTRTGRFRQGNPNLGFEQAWQFEFSVRSRPSRHLELRTGVYLKRLDGLVASVPLGFDPDSSIFGNADYGTVRGLELIAERPLRDGWGVRLLYTLQYATASSSSAFLLRRSYTIDPGTGDTIIPARVEFPLDYDRRHNLTAIVQGMAPGQFGPRVLGVRPFAAWEASLVLRFLSGLPYTPLAPPPDTLLGAPNDARLPWTGTVDMMLRRPIVLGRVRTGLYLDVRNLFNRENIVAVRRDTGSPFATNEIIEAMAEEAYAANPYAIPYESPRYRPAADLDGNGRIEGRGELFPLYVSAARDVSQPVFFYGPPRLVRLGMEVIF